MGTGSGRSCLFVLAPRIREPELIFSNPESTDKNYEQIITSILYLKICLKNLHTSRNESQHDPG
jgi:hypothetical protein